MGVAYFVCAALALLLTSSADGIATAWPPSGILLATLLMVPRRFIGRYLLAAAIASLLANLGAGTDAVAAAGFTAANLIESLIATSLLRRDKGDKVGFINPRGMGLFAGATAMAAAASACIAVAFNPHDQLHFFVSWLTTVWLGMLLVTPALMVTFEIASTSRRPVPPISAPSLIKIGLASFAVSLATFMQSTLPLLFLPMMVAVVAVLRGGALGGIIAIAIAAVVGSFALSPAGGAVSLIQAPHQVQVLFFQGYLVALFLSALPMAKLLADRERLRVDLAERVRLLDQAEQVGHIGHWRITPGEHSVYWSPEVFRIHGLMPTERLDLARAMDFCHSDDRELIKGMIDRAMHGESVEFVARVIRPDETIRHVLIRGERDYSSSNDAVGLFGIIQDVTDQVSIREQLASARDEAERFAVEALVLADTDPLTGLANRRCIVRRLNEELRDSERHGHDLSIVLFDVDHFKSVNDRFGHDVGDEVLKRVAQVASATLRETDFIGRYGGEEFILLLPCTNRSTASQIAERVRRAIEVQDFQHGPHITVSLGMASLCPGETSDAILKRADIALYEAKRAGRNRLHLAA